jgi:hypothetical protein
MEPSIVGTKRVERADRWRLEQAECRERVLVAIRSAWFALASR